MIGKHVAVLLAPFVIMGLFLGWYVDRQTQGGQVWQVRISGYDPRDLLYGHYLTYRYDWAIEGNAPVTQGPACLCLNPSAPDHREPSSRLVSCGEPHPQCQSVIGVYGHGDHYSLKPDSGVERYFIPEENAAQIESLLRDSSHKMRMALRVHGDRGVAVNGLMVDDMTLEDYLRRKK